MRLGALAEHTWGAGQGTQDLLFVAIGTGIGSGLILNGEIYRGSRGLAGEIGHITLVPNGPRCNCGRRGCLEDAAGPGHRSSRASSHGGDQNPAGSFVTVKIRL